jgi:hypothetical protein
MVEYICNGTTIPTTYYIMTQAANPTRLLNSSYHINALHGTYTCYSEFADGSAKLEEFRKEAPVSKLVYSEQFEAGSEDATTCIKVARKNAKIYNFL